MAPARWDLLGGSGTYCMGSREAAGKEQAGAKLQGFPKFGCTSWVAALGLARNRRALTSSSQASLKFARDMGGPQEIVTRGPCPVGMIWGAERMMRHERARGGREGCCGPVMSRCGM